MKGGLSEKLMAELYMARTCKWGTLRVVGGDVWNHEGDVLITPANNRLSGREGLDNMIHQKAGQELTQATRNICLEMRKINAPPCAVTHNVVTEPYALAERFKHIIHVVGPDCRRPNQDENRRDLLPQTYLNLFATLQELDGVENVISPPLSMGVFAYPHREGARLTLEPFLASSMVKKILVSRPSPSSSKKRISFQTCGRFIEKSMTCCLVLIQQMTEVYP